MNNNKIDMDIPMGAVIFTISKRIYKDIKFITKYDNIFAVQKYKDYIHIKGLSGMECDCNLSQLVNLINKKKYDTFYQSKTLSICV